MEENTVLFSISIYLLPTFAEWYPPTSTDNLPNNLHHLDSSKYTHDLQMIALSILVICLFSSSTFSHFWVIYVLTGVWF